MKKPPRDTAIERAQGFETYVGFDMVARLEKVWIAKESPQTMGFRAFDDLYRETRHVTMPDGSGRLVRGREMRYGLHVDDEGLVWSESGPWVNLHAFREANWLERVDKLSRA